MGVGRSRTAEVYELVKQEELEAEALVDADLERRSRTEFACASGIDGDASFDSMSSFAHADCDEDEGETLCTVIIEILLPFLLGGFGMVAAGVVLDTVQHWKVFVEISQLFILVPSLLGLKGNLEMTLASRLSTQANLGNMDSRSNCVSIVSSNLALVQCQGIVIGFIASLFAAVMDVIVTGEFDWKHGLLICAASVVTASIASFVLGVVMALVILSSRACNVNPDNIATPIAASLGDLVALSLLAWISYLLYNDHTNDGWLAPTIIILYFLFVPICVFVASRNDDTSVVLYTGWTPVLFAMCISSLAGLILHRTVAVFKGIAVFQPVFNGVGGNLVAVQASRISTYLHKRSPLGLLPKGVERIWVNPISIMLGSNVHSRTCRVLLGIAVPGHFIFALTISLVKAGHTTTTPIFILFYLLSAVLQIWTLMCSAHWMVLWMWKASIDPDNAAIPYLTALGDLLGGGLLAFTFKVLYVIGDRDSDVGD